MIRIRGRLLLGYFFFFFVGGPLTIFALFLGDTRGDFLGLGLTFVILGGVVDVFFPFHFRRVFGVRVFSCGYFTILVWRQILSANRPH